jgi:hypothetical protein
MSQKTAVPQDPGLYGAPPLKRQKKEMNLSSSLDFTSQLTSLISKPSTSFSNTSRARSRPSKSKTADLVANVKVKRKPGAKQPNQEANEKLTLRDPTTTEDEKAALARTRKIMEEKARLYAAMKRGDYIPREGEGAPLVDFDRKWAENRDKHGDDDDAASSSSDSDNDSSDHETGPEEMVEYEDEFGRLRTAPKSQYLAHQRRLARGLAASSALEDMSARPKAPENLIYGEAIQAEAFVAADEERMEELARKRDRSATPPESKHYDAREEIRNRGTGFYAFSKDEEERKRAMENLEREREETERARMEREEARQKKRREVEERRRTVLEKRRAKGEEKAKVMAESFLEGLEPELLAKQEDRAKTGASGARDGGNGAGSDGDGAGDALATDPAD